MSKNTSTGFLRQVRKRKSKLNKNSNLSSYERFIKQRTADLKYLDMNSDYKISVSNS